MLIFWAPSSKFVSSSIPSWQILTAHAQLFRTARDLAFCLKVPLDSLLVWASSGGSGETARMRRLAWTFAACICDKYQIRLTLSFLSVHLTKMNLVFHFVMILSLLHRRSGLSNFGEKVSLFWLTSPYFELREKFKRIEHIHTYQSFSCASAINTKNLLRGVFGWAVEESKMHTFLNLGKNFLWNVFM